MTRTLPCRCGGLVTADPGAPTEGVREHNATWRHRTWRMLPYRQCEGVMGQTCIVSIPGDRHLCHWCRRTLADRHAIR